jgi:hypothetical protein
MSFSFCRRDLLDISPVLTEAAGAIVDVSGFFFLFSSLICRLIEALLTLRVH